MMVIDLVFGCLLLFAGRSLFWVCVGIVGFLVGAQCGAALGFSDSWLALFAAIVLGSLGALLAVSFEWFAVVFGVGFLGGGYLLMNIFPPTPGQEQYAWLIFVVGGIVGMCLMIITFSWTLIIISSLLGATLIVNAFPGTPEFHVFLFIGSMAAGMGVQYLTLKDAADHGRPKRSQ